MNLKKKNVLVTGASKGIGAATAIALAKEGCFVIINYKSDTKSAQMVLDMCNNFSNGNIMLKADISSEASVKQMFIIIKDKFSSLDIIVNNAGIFDPTDSPTNIESFDRVFKNNFFGHVFVNKYALDILKQGKIINISSIHGRLGYGRPAAIAYAASKAALESYTKNLAKQLAPKILVNAVAPGRVTTPLWGKQSPKQLKELGKVHLIKRMIQPEEIADSVIFLAKNDAVCGEVLTVDEGYLLEELH